MKVGLLICDHVSDEFRGEHGEYLEMFEHLLPSLDFEPYYVIDNHFPTSVDDHAAYLCNGSMYSVYDDEPWILGLKELVREIQNRNKKLAGICFGHQMIAEALGGVVKKAPGGWCVGVHKFQISSKEKWMTPSKENVNVLMLCQDQVEQMPDTSRLIATSKDCGVSVYVINDRILGIQGHPEFSKEYEKALIIKRIERIGTDKASRGIDSLKLPMDNQVIARWIVNFLK